MPQQLGYGDHPCVNHHKSSQRILDINDKNFEIDHIYYYYINRQFLRLGESQKRNELNEVLEALAKAEFDYRLRYYYEIAESGNVKKELTQIVAALYT